MTKYINKKAFTVLEILIVTIIAIPLIGVVIDVFYGANKTYIRGIFSQSLQNKANTALNEIIEGKNEPSGIFRLSEAVSYNIVSISELHFTGTDGIERWFKLNDTATAIIYHHPASSGMVDEIISTAPVGGTIILRFSAPAGAQYTGVVVTIDVALTQNVFGNMISGSVSTCVNIRNHSA